MFLSDTSVIQVKISKTNHTLSDDNSFESVALV